MMWMHGTGEYKMRDLEGQLTMQTVIRPSVF
jgi:hypothetical protein